jgi:hypothetical protein
MTSNTHCPSLLDASLVLHVTGVVPTGNAVPEVGTHPTVRLLVQLSVAGGVAKVTTADAWPDAACVTMFAGHTTTGGCVSLTVTLNEQSSVLLDASVAVQSTGVVPTRKIEPEPGTQLTVAPGQLSLATGVVKVTVAEHCPAAALLTMLAGQLNVGGCVSLTVTLNEQLFELLCASTAVQFTGVVPTGKDEPGAGKQLTVAPGQLSVGVGVV